MTMQSTAYPVIGQWETLTVDESPMEVFVARPAQAAGKGQGPWPVVLVWMEIFGVNEHIVQVTERVAAEGYVAVALNYYHRTTPNLTLGYTEADVAIGRQHKEQTTTEGLLADAQAVLRFLATLPEVLTTEQVGVMGFCYGGHVAYLLAAMLPQVAATASFYGGGIAVSAPGGGHPTVCRTPGIRGEILCLFGDEDPLIPLEQVDAIVGALQHSGTKHQVVRYPGAGHGFFCNARADYHEAAAADAWQRMLSLFQSHLGQAEESKKAQ
ncbi:MAG: dienelactone hydrolase family protein [Candidatus Melainabacteria bacterium]|nr:dienelactone hydrolase family protein [Candidatus Melainabacteria bacterium]